MRLYWRVLNAILTKESKKNNSDKIIQDLLCKENFHKCLFALFVEVILIASNITKAVFPKIIISLGIHPAELIKTIEHFVRGEQSLPGQLRKHLRWCEEQILMKYAWQSDSLVLKELSDHIEQLVEIEKKPQPSSGTSRRRKELSYTVDKFLEKVVELAAKRVRDLCRKLALNDVIVDQVWTAVRHAIFVQFALLQDRHIYHIIIASIYGICKVNRIDMRFQQIISRYHEMDELYSPDVITGGDKKAIRDDIIHKITYVDVQGSQVKVLQGDIIKYYNLMFVAKMKSFLLLFKKNKGKGKISAVPEEPARRQQTYDMWGSQIYVSATRSSKMKTLSSTQNGAAENTQESANVNQDLSMPGVERTPRTAQLYAKREQASLNRINNFVNRSTPLHFDDDQENTEGDESPANTNEKKRKMEQDGEFTASKRFKTMAERMVADNGL